MFALHGEFLVVVIEILLNVGQISQLVAELQGSEHGVFTGQRKVGRNGQFLVGLDSGAQMAEGVKLLRVYTVPTLAEVVVGPHDTGPSLYALRPLALLLCTGGGP